jgi:DnaA family protein
MSEQIPLGLQLRTSAFFSNFIATSKQELLEQLKQMAAGGSPAQMYCWGSAGSGKTHLLQACCRHADSLGHTAAYLPLKDCHELPPDVVQCWDNFQLVCLDDIDIIAGHQAWEEALFHLYNRLMERGGHWLASATLAPAQLDIGLPDLVSRLGAGPVYQLQTLNDEQSLAAMRLRARQRGFDLPEETGRYLLRRLPRDLPALMTLLERLDTASLAAKRKLTVPFVKSVLNL